MRILVRIVAWICVYSVSIQDLIHFFEVYAAEVQFGLLFAYGCFFILVELTMHAKLQFEAISELFIQRLYFIVHIALGVNSAVWMILAGATMLSVALFVTIFIIALVIVHRFM